MTGVDGRGVVSSRGATNKGEKMAGRVCPGEGPCEEAGCLPGRVMSRLTGPSRPSEIIFVDIETYRPGTFCEIKL